MLAKTLTAKPTLALGLEGSANKLGAGVMLHEPDGSTKVLSNVRHTYITPPGEGFLPRDTAAHHRTWIQTVIGDALSKADISMKDLNCICYTKGASDWISIVILLLADELVPKVREWARHCSRSRWWRARSRCCMASH